MGESLVAEVRSIYEDIDRQIAEFTRDTGFHCPDGCGRCCDTMVVEATILECFPVAYQLFLENRADIVMDDIERRLAADNPVCIFYNPDPRLPGNGRCSMYSTRPLVCRLFGFSSRRTRTDDKGFIYCKFQNAADDRVMRNRVDNFIKEERELPVMQDVFMRISSIKPSDGIEFFPINIAIKKAIESLWWKAPPQSDQRSA